MNLIKDFGDFKKYKTINEGGGAGIEFKMEDVRVNINFELINGEVENCKVDYTLPDSFDALGYDDGMGNVSTNDMFNWNINAEELCKKIANTKLTFYDWELGSDLDFEKEGATLVDFSKQNSDTYFPVEINFSGEISSMLFGGWLRGKIEEGDTIFNSGDMNKDDVGLDFIIDNESLYLRDYDVVINHFPAITATKRLETFYKDVFKFVGEEDDDYEDHNLYLRDEYGA